MKTTISYAEARELLDKYVKGNVMRYHSLGTATAMRAIAKSLGEDEEFWGIVGLLHDLDMENIGSDLSQHGVRTVELMHQEGYDIPKLFAPILAHTEVLDGSPFKRESLLDYILSGTENLEGFIAAYVKSRVPRTIIGAVPQSIVKKLKDKSFANAVNRDTINDAIDRAKKERSEYIQLVIDALSDIASSIGM